MRQCGRRDRDWSDMSAWSQGELMEGKGDSPPAIVGSVCGLRLMVFRCQGNLCLLTRDGDDLSSERR